MMMMSMDAANKINKDTAESRRQLKCVPDQTFTGEHHKKREPARAGWPFVLISFLLFSAKQSICIPLFICLLSLR